MAELYRRMDRDRYAVIGSGGVFTATDAYRMIRLGASLVQLYTALVYDGPGVARRITREPGRRWWPATACAAWPTPSAWTRHPEPSAARSSAGRNWPSLRWRRRST